MEAASTTEEALDEATASTPVSGVTAATGIPRWTLNDLRKSTESIFGYTGSEKTLALTPGRREVIPFGIELITFMKDTRRDSELLTVKTMASFVRDEYHGWLEGYVEGKKDTVTAYESLLRRFAYRHGFVQRTPSGLKEKLADLITVRDDFAKTLKKHTVV
ncbi:hypothetical protein PC116_g26238 [Phytophthora cactorum]|nr:hypothetical protein PC116_g26238 [Phytophthora cactorum]